MKISLLERLLSTRSGRLRSLNKRVIQYLEKKPANVITAEEAQVLSFLKENGLAVFPYPFFKEYESIKIDVQYDDKVNLHYCLFDGKKLYYKDASLKKATSYFKAIKIEQDNRSPHRYLSDNFNVEANDIVLDVGAAEGNFSLSVIEKVRHIYIFEPDPNWNKALATTFAPWKEKVTIVNKFVSGISDKTSNMVALDDFLRDKHPINFIKADVEGFEIELLKGSKEILNSNKNLKLAICTYHNQEDANQIETILKDSNFTCKYSPGYMLYYYGRENVVKEPYLRRAVLRAIKN